MQDLHKVMDGKNIPMSAEEIEEFKAREAAHEKRMEELKEQQYRFDRAINYPHISDQLDMLWHAMDRGQLPRADEFYYEILHVKQRFPKP